MISFSLRLSRTGAAAVLAFGLGGAAHAEGRARPQPSDPVTEADRLFAVAKDRMKAGDVSAACEHFQRSLALAPRPGTAVNLGLCLEQEHRFAEAYQVLGQARDLVALGPFREQRDRMVQEHRRALEARFCKLRVILEEPSEDFTVTLDGTPLRGDLRDGVLVEAGPHRLSITAPGRKSVELVLEGLHAGDGRLVEVPALEPDGPPPATSSPPRPALGARDREAPTSLLGAEHAPAAGEPPSERHTAWYWVGGGVLLGGLAVGAYALAHRSSPPSERSPDFRITFP